MYFLSVIIYMSNPFIDDIEKLTLNNDNFRHVIYTSDDKKMQLVLMSLKPKQSIGMEVHETVNQFFRIEKGKGKLFVNNEKKYIKKHDAIIIPAGTKHNIKNISKTKELKLYTIYTPANHPDNTKQKNKVL